MQFTQPVFFLFILFFFFGWRLLNGQSALRLFYLVVASLVFYSFADWHPMLVLFAVGLASYLGSIGLEKQPRLRIPILFTSLTVCLGLLFISKYSGFALTNVANGLALFGLKVVPDPALIAIRNEN